MAQDTLQLIGHAASPSIGLSALSLTTSHEGSVAFPDAAPDVALVGKKSGPLYSLHPYWSKKPYDAIGTCIRHFTKESEIVLDPFCGSGSTLVAAALSGRRCLCVDASPAAFHVARLFALAAHGMSASEQVVTRWLTALDRETATSRRIEWNQSELEIEGLIYTERYRCPKCYTWRSLARRREIDNELCCDSPGCEEPISTRSHSLQFGPADVTRAELRDLRTGRRLEVDCLAEPALARILSDSDQAIVSKLDGLPLPAAPLAQELLDFGGRLNTTGTTSVPNLYTPRSLFILATARKLAEEHAKPNERATLLGLVTAVSLNCTKMYRVREGGGGGPATSFYVPAERKEVSVLRSLRDKASELLQAAQRGLHQPASAVLWNASVDRLSALPSDSIDYIFTDPPYADTMPYGALNCVWEAWLGAGTDWRGEEVLGRNWDAGVATAFREMGRVLKPGRWMTLCYHDTSEGTWERVQDLAAEAGLLADRSMKAASIDSKQKSWQQQVADKVVKRDLLVHFQKPLQGGLQTSVSENGSFHDDAKTYLQSTLSQRPGSTKDRLYDDLVSRMVRAGQMRAHNFDELLREVADEVKDAGGASRWYLKETEEGQVDAAEAAKEDAAAKAMEKFIAKTLEKSYAEGVHYSDLFEHYLYAVKDKPRRSLADWLPDYFFKTEDGTWRLPVDEDERELKEQARASGENRRIKRYAAMLQAGVAVPKERVPTAATLAEWIRHAKRSGLYEAGKLLYERGGLDASKLSEEQQVEVEEDYQVCVRALQRAAGGKAPTVEKKKGRKKKAEADE
jgi:16S rRNA G966 N2-methylase RsmD